MKHLKNIAILLFILSFSIIVFGQNNGKIKGKVTFGEKKIPLHDAIVQIVQLKRTTQTDDDGNFEFSDVPAGSYTILVHLDGFSDSSRSLVFSGAEESLDFELKIGNLREEVTVTSSGTEQSVLESFQSVNSIGSARISQRASTSVGEVLEDETGVAKRSFGPGSSRPIIRGFDGDRVLVTQDGIRTNSIGSQSGDHGEPIDVLSLERIEVVKGPATLLYGSNALGGVVNAISNHENSSHEGVRGYFSVLGSSANKQGALSGGLEFGVKNWVFRGNGSFQRQGDYQTPIGKIPNSASRSDSGSFGAGYYADKMFFGVDVSLDKRRYGIPFGALFEEEKTKKTFFGELPPTPDEDIDIKMRTYDFRVKGGFRNLNSFITGGNFSFDYNRYRHLEIEIADGVEAIGTTFRNKTFSYRAVFEQKPFEKLTGRFGFEGFNRKYQVAGAEALIEGGEVKHDSFSAFALEELNFGKIGLQFGGRVENNRYNPLSNELQDRKFTGVSGAAGVKFNVWEGGTVVANFTSSFRAPALEELYNNGPHVGNVTFEIGDNGLKRERSNGIDFSVRHLSNRLRVTGDVYYYSIKNFVYLAFVDEDGDGEIDIEDGLPVARFSQNDSRFFGADLNLDVKINNYFGIYFGGDAVSAKLTDVGRALPRIPPVRGKLGLDFNYKGLNVRPEAIFAKTKDDVFTLETRTPGYTTFNVSGSYVIGTKHFAHIFNFNAYNLTDKLYRNHLSLIKEISPEIGRGVRFGYTIRFF